MIWIYLDTISKHFWNLAIQCKKTRLYILSQGLQVLVSSTTSAWQHKMLCRAWCFRGDHPDRAVQVIYQSTPSRHDIAPKAWKSWNLKNGRIHDENMTQVILPRCCSHMLPLFGVCLSQAKRQSSRCNGPSTSAEYLQIVYPRLEGSENVHRPKKDFPIAFWRLVGFFFNLLKACCKRYVHLTWLNKPDENPKAILEANGPTQTWYTCWSSSTIKPTILHNSEGSAAWPFSAWLDASTPRAVHRNANVSGPHEPIPMWPLVG